MGLFRVYLALAVVVGHVGVNPDWGVVTTSWGGGLPGVVGARTAVVISYVISGYYRHRLASVPTSEGSGGGQT